MPDYGFKAPPGRGVTGKLRAYRARLARYLGRLVDRNDVDDILQEAFMRSFEAAAKPPVRNPRAFLLRAASNLGISPFARVSNRLNAHKEDLSVPEVAQLSVESLESPIPPHQRFVSYSRAVGGLPEECRRAFILKKVYGLSQQDIADRLGIPRRTVEKHIAQGLMTCRDYLETATHPVPGSDGDPDTRKSGHRHT